MALAIKMSGTCSLSSFFRSNNHHNDDKSDVRDEFSGLHSELMMKKLTRHSLEKALEDMDANGDGQIQFNEFAQWMERQ